MGVFCWLALARLADSIETIPKTAPEDARIITADGFYSGKLAGRSGDHYCLQLKQSAKVTVSVKMDSASGVFVLYGSDHTEYDAQPAIYDSRLGCYLIKKHLYLQAGCCYFKLSGSKGAYAFRIKSVPVKESFPETENSPNDCPDNADAVSLDTVYTGMLGYGDAQDFYRFSMPFSGQVQIFCRSQSAARLRCYILDPQGEETAGFYSTPSRQGASHDGQDEFFSLPKGEYYLKISGDWELQHGQYDFRITARLDPVQTVQAHRRSSRAFIKLKKQSDATGYLIEYSADKSFARGRTVKKISSTPEAVLKGLKKGTIYYVRVRAYKILHGKTYYGAYGPLSCL